MSTFIRVAIDMRCSVAFPERDLPWTLAFHLFLLSRISGMLQKRPNPDHAGPTPDNIAKSDTDDIIPGKLCNTAGVSLFRG